MQTFTIGVGRAWWIRLVGRDPLVRRTDRIEPRRPRLRSSSLRLQPRWWAPSVHHARRTHLALRRRGEEPAPGGCDRDGQTPQSSCFLPMLSSRAGRHGTLQAAYTTRSSGRPVRQKAVSERLFGSTTKAIMPGRRHRQVALPVTPSASPCRSGSER